MSLVDQSMVPFQTAYPMIVIVIFLILAGNTAYVSHFLSNSRMVVHRPLAYLVSMVECLSKSRLMHILFLSLRFTMYVPQFGSSSARLNLPSRWIISKVVPGASRLNETLHFLLDHPRRCYIYLFPSYQTWFLLTIIVLLTYYSSSLTSWLDAYPFAIARVIGSFSWS